MYARVRKGVGGGGVISLSFTPLRPPAAWQTSKCTWDGPQKGKGIVASCGRTVPTLTAAACEDLINSYTNTPPPPTLPSPCVKPSSF